MRGKFWPIWQWLPLGSVAFSATGNRVWLIAAAGRSGRSGD